MRHLQRILSSRNGLPSGVNPVSQNPRSPVYLQSGVVAKWSTNGSHAFKEIRIHSVRCGVRSLRRRIHARDGNATREGNVPMQREVWSHACQEIRIHNVRCGVRSLRRCEIKSSSCQCKGFQKLHNRGLHCKHVRAVGMKYEHGNSICFAASASDSPLSCAAPREFLCSFYGAVNALLEASKELLKNF